MLTRSASNPVYVSSQVELCQILGISKSTLHGLCKLKGAPVRVPSGYHVPRWRKFCLKKMASYQATMKANPITDLHATLDVCFVMEEDAAHAMKCFWQAVDDIQDTYAERIKTQDRVTVLDDYTGDLATAMQQHLLPGWNND